MEGKVSRVRIDIIQGIIELEGSEGFVSKYLDEFKGSLEKRLASAPAGSTVTGGEVARHKAPDSSSKSASETKPVEKKKTSTAAKSVRAEAFEIKPAGQSSLEDFFNSKGAPSPHSKRIAIIGYYVTEVLKHDFFTEGNVEFAYKILKLNRPKYVRQACTDAKNQQQYLDVYDRGEAEPSAWHVSRIGEIYVEDEAKQQA